MCHSKHNGCRILTAGVLELLSSLGATWLLAFHSAAITGEVDTWQEKTTCPTFQCHQELTEGHENESN
jgi:hypothetical protein